MLTRIRRLAGLLGVLGLLVILAGLLGYHHRLALGLEAAGEQGRNRLALSQSSLERDIDKYAFLPSTLAVEQEVLAFLRAPHPSAAAITAMSLYLEQINARAGTLSVYLLDRQGRVAATSNWRQADSFLGEDLSYRPYFRQALRQGAGRFFGIGTTRGEPGYYLSAVVSEGGATLGVAVVKASLDPLEQFWAALGPPVMVEDENGVAILCSVPAWRYGTLTPLSPALAQSLFRDQHYNRHPLRRLPVLTVRALGPDSRLMTLGRSDGRKDGDEYLVQSRVMAGTGWRLLVFSPLAAVRSAALGEAALVAVAAAFLCLLGLLIRQAGSQIRERLRARAALQRAHDELERKVAERTADLVAADQRLRSAQEELVQAGKLAVIGQLSAGVAHELNQPLAALRTLSGNAAKFLDRGDLATARGNLERIGALVEGMGRITGQLKAFARRSTGQARPVALRPVLDNALFLLEGRLKRAGVRVRLQEPEGGAVAHCDPNRLEQVLVNLMGNAADAMEAGPGKEMAITVTTAAGRVLIQVRDQGPGLSPAVRDHLFEPFFTTKDTGGGLGLGLPISAGIVRDFGGTLQGANHQEGGAVFTVELPAGEGTA